MSTYDDLSNLVKIYWSLLLGNIVEWYEFAAYAYLAIYLEDNIFQGSQVAVWLGFSVTFVARPLGGTVLGWFGDVFGRSAALNLSIIGMLIGTCGQGLLPTFKNGEMWGRVGLVLLVLLRFLQGLSAAGEISTISAYITEVSPKESLGRSISLIAITCNVGFLLAKAVVFVTRTLAGAEAMAEWGWRIPFLFALVPGLIAVWGRASVPESEAFVEANKDEGDEEAEELSPSGRTRRTTASGSNAVTQKQSPIEIVLFKYWRNVLVGIGGVASYAILQYGGFVWMQSYLAHRGLDPSSRMEVSLVSRVLMIALGMPCGWLADVKGVGWVTLVGAAMLTATALPAFYLIDAYTTNLTMMIAVISVGLSIVGVLCGTVFFLFVAELFPVEIRSTGAGMAYNFGFAIFGGFAPILAQTSLSWTPLGPGYLLMAGGAITAITVLAGATMQKQGSMQMAHVRPYPYLGKGVKCDDGATESTGTDSGTTSSEGTSDPEEA